jgi:hypothetical protein
VTAKVCHLWPGLAFAMGDPVTITHNFSPSLVFSATQHFHSPFIPPSSTPTLCCSTVALHIPVTMLKRMTSKLHIGKYTSHHASLTGTPIKTTDVPPVVTGRLDFRGSISTERTSQSSKRGDSLDAPPFSPTPLVRRPRGCYKLSDFLILRTLGTGSFGRVHLGLFAPPRARLSYAVFSSHTHFFSLNSPK